MAGVPISLLPNSTLPYSGAERFAFVQDGETRANNFQSLISFYEDYFVTYDLLGSLSGNWQATYIALEVRGALWDASYSITSSLSSNWNSVYSTVQTYSGDWGSSNNFCGETVYLETVDPCPGTGDTITINANLDIQGFSINNIGNSSLNFESGAKISSNTNGGVLILPNPSNIPGKWGTAIGLNCSAPAAQSLASGKNTTASGDWSMAHGLNNTAAAPYSIAAGGGGNVIDPLGLNSAILGGRNNRVSVSDSTAIGTYAQNTAHAGSFVFADGSTTAAFTPVSANSFNIKASGGLRLVDGFEAAGRVLVCDADGTGHWGDTTGGGANVNVQSTPPDPASEGDLWFDDGSGVLYIRYDETWVDASAGTALDGSQLCGKTVYMTNLSACSPSNTISLTGDLDLNGGSLLNVGNNSITFESGAVISSDVSGNISFTGSTIVDTMCATTIHSTSSFTHYQDIIVSELSGFSVTGDVDIAGNVDITGTLSAQTLSANNGDSNLWSSAYTQVNSLSDTWDSTYTTVTANSASWGIDTVYDDSSLQAASGDWNSTYTTVSANSANWSVDALQIAASDETTDLTTGIVTTFRAPYAMELTDVRASVTTAPVGAAITVDVTANGTTIFSTIVSIDVGDKTSVGSAAPRVISTTSIPDDAELKVDIKTVGSTTAGSGLKLSFIGYKS